MKRKQRNIYTNHQGGNLVHKHKTLIFGEVQVRAAPKYTQIRWTKKRLKKCIASNHNPYFRKLPKSTPGNPEYL